MNDSLQLHLFFNHAPLIGGFAALLVVIMGLLMRNNAVRVAGLVVYVVMALTVIPTYLTGEGAEERVEHGVEFNHDALEVHEDHAELALWIMLAGAALALVTVVAQWKSMKPAVITALTIAFLLVATISVIKMAFTAHEGGQVRRPELRTANPGT